jgi:uncharacterized membrane protein
VENSKHIILADVPNLSPALQKKVINTVKNGAKLLILGGNFTLAKGNFHNTLLGEKLPVELGTVFNIKGNFYQPIRMKLDGAEGNLYLYQELKPKKDAEVLYSVNGIPLIIRCQFGQGTITVFTGTPEGAEGKSAFWNTDFTKKIFELGLK